jgi:hypothetical protein
MGSVKLTRFKLPHVALSVKFSKWKKEIDLFIRNVRGNLFQNRIYIESLFYILIHDIPPLPERNITKYLELNHIDLA